MSVPGPGEVGPSEGGGPQPGAWSGGGPDTAEPDGPASRAALGRIAIAVAVAAVLLVVAAVAFLANRSSGEADEGAVHGFPLPVAGGPRGPDLEQLSTVELDCSGGCKLAAKEELLFVARTEGGSGSEATTNAVEVMAYDGAGEEVWPAPALVEDGGSLVAHEDVVLVVGSGGVSAIDVRDGSVRWEADGRPQGELAGSSLLMGAPFGMEPMTLVVDPITGDERWRSDGSPVPCGDVVVVQESGGDVVARDELDGTERWRREGLVGSVDACDPAGLAVVGEDEVLVLGRDDGEEIGRLALDGGAVVRVAVLGGELFVHDGGELSRHGIDGRLQERWVTEATEANYLMLRTEQSVTLIGPVIESYALADGERLGSVDISAGQDLIVSGRDVVVTGEDVIARSLQDLATAWQIDVADVREVAFGEGRVHLLVGDEIRSFG